jgi:chemotaxis protein histidine kinase CheA
VLRGFRVLFYFNSRSATKANGRLLIDGPQIEDLSRERDGQCVTRISPGTTEAEVRDESNSTHGMTLDAFLVSRKVAPLDARPLTLRWHGSTVSDNVEEMKKWATAFEGVSVDSQLTKAGTVPAASEQRAGEPQPAAAVQKRVVGDPPRGLCWKQKMNIGLTWPERYIALEVPAGKPHMGLYVYAKEGDSEPRVSSIETLVGCEITKGTETWMIGGDKAKLTLSADHVPEKAASFCFETEVQRDEFASACLNLSEGRPWHLSAAQEAQDKADAEAAEQQRIQDEIDRRVAEATQAAEAEAKAKAEKAEADAAETIRAAKEAAVAEERERAAKAAQEKKLRMEEAAKAIKGAKEPAPAPTLEPEAGWQPQPVVSAPPSWAGSHLPPRWLHRMGSSCRWRACHRPTSTR